MHGEVDKIEKKIEFSGIFSHVYNPFFKNGSKNRNNKHGIESSTPASNPLINTVCAWSRVYILCYLSRKVFCWC